MTQKICFDCFHKLFPDKPIRKVTLGRQCVVCKAQTDRTEQMIPVEAEDIPLVKQIAEVPRRVLHRIERHADRRVAVRVAARGAGQVGRDAGRAGPRDPRHVRAMSADLEKAQAEGWLAYAFWRTEPFLTDDRRSPDFPKPLLTCVEPCQPDTGQKPFSD